MKRHLLYAMIFLLAAPPELMRADVSAPPPLPTAQDIKALPANDDTNSKASVDVPQGEPQAIKQSVEVKQKKEGRFRWGNLVLGALGGAILAGGVGLVIGAAQSNTGSLQGSKVAILCGAGAVAGGLLSFLLGATSPPPATPPDMNSYLPNLNQAPMLGNANGLVVRVQF